MPPLKGGIEEEEKSSQLTATEEQFGWLWWKCSVWLVPQPAVGPGNVPYCSG